MNSRRRNQSPGRPGMPQVQFCPRCGGMLSAQHGGASPNVCRCSKEEREKYRDSSPSPETAPEEQQ